MAKSLWWVWLCVGFFLLSGIADVVEIVLFELWRREQSLGLAEAWFSLGHWWEFMKTPEASITAIFIFGPLILIFVVLEIVKRTDKDD